MWRGADRVLPVTRVLGMIEGYGLPPDRITVIPGLTPYASPLELFEYFRLGRATVAPDIDAIGEILTNGQDAVLFDPAAERDLEAALLRLCKDAPLRARLGSAGSDTIRSLTWTRNAERVVVLAGSLLRPASSA